VEGAAGDAERKIAKVKNAKAEYSSEKPRLKWRIGFY
jgi:hypothetical protein